MVRDCYFSIDEIKVYEQFVYVDDSFELRDVFVKIFELVLFSGFLQLVVMNSKGKKQKVKSFQNFNLLVDFYNEKSQSLSYFLIDLFFQILVMQEIMNQVIN